MSPLRYVSTRGAAPELGFADVLLAGLARDGGLYVPERWPSLTVGAFERFADMSLPGRGHRGDVALRRGVRRPRRLRRPRGRRLRHLRRRRGRPARRRSTTGSGWPSCSTGPTLAFKDVALQLVGRLFDHELARRGERVTVVGATSGDTGSAAIEALRDRDAVDVFILHPAGRVSEVQRRQMTTVRSPNVHNFAVEGTFDDCQDLVKALFADTAFRDRRNLSAVNSINWARVMAQVVYYVTSAARLGAAEGRPVAFSVPTGNFGNVFAGYGAQRMGTPITRFVVASNRNDILTRFLTSGTMTIGEVHPTLSPSHGHPGVVEPRAAPVRALRPRRGGGRRADGPVPRRGHGLARGGADRPAGRALGRRPASTTTPPGRPSPPSTDRSGRLVDPHTAVGLAAARARRGDPDVPMVVLATAHPAKFPDAVEAGRRRPPLAPCPAGRPVRAAGALRGGRQRPRSGPAGHRRDPRRAHRVTVRPPIWESAQMKYVVCVPDGCADQPLAELGGRTPLEAASTPTLDALAARGEVGRAAVIPPGHAAGLRRGQHGDPRLRPGRTYHTGRAPIEAAALGLKLAPDQVAYRCNLVTVGPDGTMVDFAGGHPSSEDAAEAVVRRLDDALGGDGVEFHPGVQYRHIVVAPSGVGRGGVHPAPRPHRPARRVAVRSGAGTGSGRSWTRPATSWAGPRSPPTRSGSGARASSPGCPPSSELRRLDAALVTAVDLVRGPGCAHRDRGRRARHRDRLVRHRLRGQAGLRPRRPRRRRRPVRRSTSRPPTRPATPAT